MIITFGRLLLICGSEQNKQTKLWLIPLHIQRQSVTHHNLSIHCTVYYLLWTWSIIAIFLIDKHYLQSYDSHDYNKAAKKAEAPLL